MRSLLCLFVSLAVVAVSHAAPKDNPLASDVYSKVYKLASNGSVILYVGVPASKGEFRIDTPDGWSPGVYHCYPVGGKPYFEPAKADPVLQAPCYGPSCPTCPRR